jgi:hypothetical protein
LRAQAETDERKQVLVVCPLVVKNDGSAFVRAPKNFLFPVRVLSRVFREKYLDALQALQDKGKLDLGAQPADAGWQQLLQALRTHACARKRGQAQLIQGSSNSKRKRLLAYLFQWFLFVLLSGTSPFSELAALTGHCFDLGVEAAVSDGLVLI